MNIGHFIYTTARNLMNLGSKLYDIFTTDVDISWVSKILSFFNSSANLPNTISLSYVLGGISAVALLGMIIYNVFKF